MLAFQTNIIMITNFRRNKNMDTQKINIGYARVSTMEQVKTGYSIEFQQERIKEQFEKINIEDYRIFVDDGVSGRTLNRLKIKMIIQMIQSNKVSSVVVYKLDRLSRNITDLIYF